ncbi:putative capsid protein [Vibrio astriarenae]|nr:putative capsid protein [Vibrio sp. C7]
MARTKVGRRAAMYLTVIGIMFALGLTTMVAINALLSTINYDSVPWLEQGFSYFIPSNAVPCLSVIFSARVIRWVWDWQFYAVNKAAS